MNATYPSGLQSIGLPLLCRHQHGITRQITFSHKIIILFPQDNNLCAQDNKYNLWDFRGSVHFYDQQA